MSRVLKKKWIKIVGAKGHSSKINLNGKGEFQINGSYVYVEGLEIFNGTKSNVRIASTTKTLSHVYLKNLKLYSIKNAPGATLRIQRNNANGVGVSSILVENCDLSQGLPVSVVEGVGVSNVIIKDNYIHTDSGYAAGITFKGGSSRIVIEGNVIKGVRKNPAILMGGRTFLNFFDPQFPNQEGVDQIARNNIIIDFDEAAVSFQGIRSAKFIHNTIVTASSGPIFSFSEGNTNNGAQPSKNEKLSIDNNLIVTRSASTVIAVNEAGAIPGLQFGKQMWVGTLLNARYGRASIPQLPHTTDVSLSLQKSWTVFESLQWKDISNLETARARFTPKSSATERSIASHPDVATDSLGRTRSQNTAFGAIEY